MRELLRAEQESRKILVQGGNEKMPKFVVLGAGALMSESARRAGAIMKALQWHMMKAA